MTQRQPALFLGHGSPMTVITDNPARDSFVALGQVLPRPSAILCISAHYETAGATHLTGQPLPPTIHDFRGFPPELFAMRYPAPGSAGLVSRVLELARGSVVADDRWGFDHGVWGVLQPMFPACDVPTVAMSLNRALDDDGHLALAAALAPLRDEGVLIVGSGNIIHNLALWRQAAGRPLDWALGFGQRIVNAVLADDRAALTGFAPDDEAAALAVNSAEHYLPLLYAVGARLPGDGAAVFNDTIDGALAMASFLIGDVDIVARMERRLG